MTGILRWHYAPMNSGKSTLALVAAFGIPTDFRSVMFPGSQRLFEIADEHCPVQAPALCWCGRRARMNARLVNDVMVVDGDQVVVGNTEDDHQGLVRYMLLCRPHFMSQQTSAFCSLAGGRPLRAGVLA